MLAPSGEWLGTIIIFDHNIDLRKCLNIIDREGVKNMLAVSVRKTAFCQKQKTKKMHFYQQQKTPFLGQRIRGVTPPWQNKFQHPSSLGIWGGSPFTDGFNLTPFPNEPVDVI